MAVAPVAAPSDAPGNGRLLVKRSTIVVSLHPIAVRTRPPMRKRRNTSCIAPIQRQNKWAKMWRRGGRDMKLFGGKKGDEKAPMQQDDDAGYYDSPVENVSLSDRSSGKPASASNSAAASSAASSNKVAVNQHVDDEPRPHYGIEQAITLMRALPVDQNPALVVAVIKGTLESLKVKVTDIIADAERKQKDLEERVSNLKRAIADFEKEIATRKEEIERLEADHKETTAVRGRLELAEKAQTGAPVAKTG